MASELRQPSHSPSRYDFDGARGACMNSGGPNSVSWSSDGQKRSRESFSKHFVCVPDTRISNCRHARFNLSVAVAPQVLPACYTWCV